MDSDFNLAVSKDEDPVVFFRDFPLAHRPDEIGGRGGTCSAGADGLELNVGGVESLRSECLGGDDGELFCSIVLCADAFAEVERYDF